MKAADILLLATSGTVVAFHRASGARLWEAKLKGNWNGQFVSLVADESRVFAHTKGELFCLDLFSGRLLWEDGLKGMGYGLASLALPGSAEAKESLSAEIFQQEEAENQRRRESSRGNNFP